MARHVAEARAELEVASCPPRVVLRPKAVDDSGFRSSSARTPPTARSSASIGERPTRWVRQTDFSNDEAVGYLADRLGRAGVEEALFKAGAVAGATVAHRQRQDNAVVFDWEPTMSAGAELLTGPRGTDLRLDDAAPPDPRGEARGLRRPPGRPDGGARGARRRAPRRSLGRRGPGGRRGGAAAGGQLRTGRRAAGRCVDAAGGPAARSLDFGRVHQPPSRPHDRQPARGQGRLELADHGAG